MSRLIAAQAGLWGQDHHVHQLHLIAFRMSSGKHSSSSLCPLVSVLPCSLFWPDCALCVLKTMPVLLLALLGLLSALVQASAQRILNLKANDPMLHFREGWQIATVSNTVQSFLLTNKTGLALKVDLPGQYTAITLCS